MLDTDFAFHWDGGGDAFSHLRVVRFDIRDAMSAPFEATLLLHTRKADDDLDPYDLVGKVGTLRIATGTDPHVRAFHGLIVSAEDRGATSHGSLYEIVMMPPLARAMHRRRSRIFLEKTTRQIIEAVLRGDPKMSAGDADGSHPDDLRGAFSPPAEKYAFRLKDTARIDDKNARHHCVQYEESDFDFVSRLLEEDGIAYHFEHTDKQIVFVMSDNDAGRARLDPADPLAPDVLGRQLDAMRMGGRLRPTKVKLLDYNWQKPKLDMGAEAKGDGDDLFVVAYPGRHRESSDKGAQLAKASLERFQTEARHATAAGGCRLLGAGTIFAFHDPVARFEGEYLVTKARLRGIAEGELPPGEGPVERLPGGGPFHCDVELVRRGHGKSPDESKFRPPRHTPKPLIHGTQTATVVDEPSNRGVEIHVGGPDGNENGCVRLKFPWDVETDRHDKEPTSKWVRVSQVFAGAGGGAVAHPRVGTEVIVAYENGDPDKPVVVGRVYNGIQPAAALGKGAATVTTLKSLSSPGGKVWNEFQFNDTAGKEQVNLHAGKDWNSDVGNNRTESVTNDSKSTVKANRTEKTGGKRDTEVTGSNTEKVDGHEKVTVGGGQEVIVTGAQDISVSGNRSLSVGASHSISVTGAEDHTITGAHSLTASASQTVSVGASKTEGIGASYDLSIAAAMTVGVGAVHVLNTPIAITNAPVCATNGIAWTVSASAKAEIDTSDFKAISGGPAVVEGATVTINGSGEVTISGGAVKIKGGSITIVADGALKLNGATVEIAGGTVKVN